MKNEIALFEKAGLPMTAVATGLRALAEAKSQAGGMMYLRLAKAGYFVFGADDTEVQPGSKWVVNAASFQTGFTAWTEDGVNKGERMLPVNEGAVSRASLPDVGCEWKPQVSVELKCVLGDDKGTDVLYKASSKGGRDALSELAGIVFAKVGDGSGFHHPIVLLEVDSYQHKNRSYGRIFTPDLKVVGWMNDAGEVEGESKAPAATPAGGRRRGAAAVEPEADAPAAAAGAGRRRRPAAGG
jgi:hypothetical protein